MAKGILVALYRKIHDQDKLTAYATDAAPVMKGQGIRFFARTTNIQSLKGLAPVRAVVGEFPIPEAVVATYHSKEYQEALSKLD